MSSPQNLRVEKGRRTGRTIIVCIDSTTLGSALGGCRIRSYTSWQDGVQDAVRLAAAMTEKAALAGLAHGGGKTVVALDPHDAPLTGAARRELDDQTLFGFVRRGDDLDLEVQVTGGRVPDPFGHRGVVADCVVTPPAGYVRRGRASPRLRRYSPDPPQRSRPLVR